MPSDTRCPTCDGTGNARCSACPRFPDAACCYPEPTCPPCPDCNGSGRHDTPPANTPRDYGRIFDADAETSEFKAEKAALEAELREVREAHMRRKEATP